MNNPQLSCSGNGSARYHRLWHVAKPGTNLERLLRRRILSKYYTSYKDETINLNSTLLTSHATDLWNYPQVCGCAQRSKRQHVSNKSWSTSVIKKTKKRHQKICHPSAGLQSFSCNGGLPAKWKVEKRKRGNSFLPVQRADKPCRHSNGTSSTR